MNKESYRRFQSLINDILGTILVFWSMALITSQIIGNTPIDWPLVVLVLIGGSMVVGKQVVSQIPGLGGGNDTVPDIIKEGQSAKPRQ